MSRADVEVSAGDGGVVFDATVAKGQVFLVQ